MQNVTCIITHLRVLAPIVLSWWKRSSLISSFVSIEIESKISFLHMRYVVCLGATHEIYIYREG